MRTFTKLLFLIATLTLTTACKKEIETITVPVDKMYSWTEIKQITGSQKIIVQITKSASSLYLQMVAYLGTITPQSSASTKSRYYSAYTYAYNPLPSDLRNRLPMNSNFYVNQSPIKDSVLLAYPTAYFPPTNYPCSISLPQLDPHGLRYVNNLVGPYFSFGAINRNDYLLVGYVTDKISDNALHFVLSKLSAPAASYSGPIVADSRTLTVPVSNFPTFQTIATIDDYFLVDCYNAGLYKITQDGKAKQVFNGYTGITNFYKWQGTLYAVQSDGQNGLLTSTDDGETWQRHTGVPNYFHYSTFCIVGDSLVGISHGIATNSLYTLRWQGLNYRVRELKNDGLNQADFTDLVQFGDTVYLGTTGGLFKRPLNKFFESK